MSASRATGGRWQVVVGRTVIESGLSKSEALKIAENMNLNRPPDHKGLAVAEPECLGDSR